MIEDIKFSILIPTKDRLELLKSAVFSIRTQNYSNYEIIIADNNSSEEVQEYLKEIEKKDTTIFKSSLNLSVTSNWNIALNAASGDYFIMLGDDDALVPGALSRLFEIIKKYESPDAVYSNCFLYAWPDAVPNSLSGYLKSYSNREIFDFEGSDQILDIRSQKRYVRSALDFNVAFDFNMQFWCIRLDSLIESINKPKGMFQFVGDYPDYYASLMFMYYFEKIVISREETVLIGISKKSYGSFYQSNQRERGDLFLNPRIRKHFRLGVFNNMNRLWLRTYLKLPLVLKVRINFYRYVKIQLLYLVIDPNKNSLNNKILKYFTYAFFGAYYLYILVKLTLLGKKIDWLSFFLEAGTHPLVDMPDIPVDCETIYNVLDYLRER